MPDLSDGINWSEIDANNNNAAPNGWPEGMMPSGVNDAARADRGAMKRFWDKLNPVQLVTPSGGVYTFTTASPAYPTAYVAGEIYSFKPNANAVGGDLFQVNALGAKPIWKRVDVHTWAPIIAQDILVGEPPQLIYNDVLNGGTGVFVLLNPFVPIHGDGAGGVSVPGALTVAGDLTMAGAVSANGGMSINGDLQVTGRLSTPGYGSRSGVSGPDQTNLFNIQWTGADGAHLWIDTADLGPIVTGSAGNVVIGGNASVGSLTASGSISGGSISTGGAVTAGSISTVGAITAGSISTGGDVAASGILRTTSNGPSSGGVSVYATAGAIRSDVSGTALYLPNGNVVCQGISAAAASTLMGTAISSGNIDTPGTITSRFLLQCLTTGTNNAQVTLANGVRSWSTTVAADGSYNINDNSGGATRLTIDTGGAARHNGNIYPAGPNNLYCGTTANYWYQVNTGAGGVVTNSDPSLKRNITAIPEGCLALVQAIEPKTYEFKTGPPEEEGKMHWGFLAPDVADVMKKAGHRFDAIYTENGLSSLAYHEMIAVLWGAVQELSDKLEAKG